ncbi:hypothetical protein IB286_06255 [Spongiibacter sp. KMU-158]|uniref:DUF4398 domain-containing protein n=1 Tax=Spongiibacter pelagi TaxID=2760804 RepID=A0A927C1U4_9GAMM|nr:hypothetical protein [Spongiibacter pelagi]MBD2858608.1 hypothetical protein [Spongiibacter pelagi]
MATQPINYPVAVLATAIFSFTLAACSSQPENPAAPTPPNFANSDSHSSAGSNAHIDPEQALSNALQQLHKQHYLAAEGSLSQLSNSTGAAQNIKNTARAALILLYLDKSNTRYSIDRATTELDKLYFQRNPNSEQESLLFMALKIAVERSLEVVSADQLKRGSELALQEKEQQVIALQAALEKLRRLSFE